MESSRRTEKKASRTRTSSSSETPADGFIRRKFHPPASGISSAKASVVVVRKALREEREQPERKKIVILKNLPEATAELDKSLVEEIATQQIVQVVKVFRLGKEKEGVNRLLRVIFNSVEEANSFLKGFSNAKNIQKDARLAAVSARKDYVESDLVLYKKAWSDVIDRNNTAAERRWTVVETATGEFRIVPVKVVTPWIVSTKKAETVKKD